MSTQTIIVILRKRLIVCHVKPDARKPIFDVREYGWDEKTLDIVLGKVKNIYKTQTVRVLFTREVSYVLRISVPRDLELTIKREVILAKLLERVPEVLEDSDFDFRLITDDPLKENQEVLAFAPVKEVSHALRNAIDEVGVIIEASEPEDLAKTRNVNPIIGIAMKDDIQGKDEEVLTLKFAENNGEEAHSRDNNRNKTKPHLLRNTIFIFVTILLFALAVALLLIQFKIILSPFS